MSSIFFVYTEAKQQRFSPLQRLQEAETRNQELSQSVTSATRPLLRQIENLQASLGGQTASWEKLEKSISDRLGRRLEVYCSTVYKAGEPAGTFKFDGLIDPGLNEK